MVTFQLEVRWHPKQTLGQTRSNAYGSGVIYWS
jgi:hypothetical protein